MARACSVCRHPHCGDIDRALVASEPFRRIANRFGTTARSLQRHKRHHLTIEESPQVQLPVPQQEGQVADSSRGPETPAQIIVSIPAPNHVAVQELPREMPPLGEVPCDYAPVAPLTAFRRALESPLSYVASALAPITRPLPPC